MNYLPVVLSALCRGRALLAQVSNFPTKHRSRAAAAALAVACLGAAGARAATLTVNTTADSSDSSCGSTCSLRDAITQANANPGSTIPFSVTGTITLSSSLPVIGANTTIQGPGANQLTISGAGAYGILEVSSGTVSISGLTFANGIGFLALDENL